MNALFVTSVEPYSGKTAVCLALGKQLQAMGKAVGYLKPMSTQPWRTPQGSIGDEDTGFVRRALGLEIPESPVIVTRETLHERLSGGFQGLLDQIKEAAESAGRNVDLLLLEGGASLREGYAMGLSNIRLAEALRCSCSYAATEKCRSWMTHLRHTFGWGTSCSESSQTTCRMR